MRSIVEEHIDMLVVTQMDHPASQVSTVHRINHLIIRASDKLKSILLEMSLTKKHFHSTITSLLGFRNCSWIYQSTPSRVNLLPPGLSSRFEAIKK
jgi:hypothetical protein